MAETSKISNSNSSVTIILPKFIAERMPFYTNPKERHFLQEVLSANQSILGTSLYIVIYVGIVLGVHSSFTMSRIGSDGYPVSMEGNVCWLGTFLEVSPSQPWVKKASNMEQ